MARTTAREWSLGRGLLAALVLCALCAADGLAAEGVRKVRKDMQVEDLGAVVRARTVTGPVVYKEPASGQMHFNCTLEACNDINWDTDPMHAGEAPFQIFDLNLETGQSRILPGRYGRTGVPFMHSNGKMYFFTTRPPALLEYDPAAGKTRDLGRMPLTFYIAAAQSRQEGPDKRLYLGMYGLHVVIFDPATEKFEDLGDLSDGHCKRGYVYYIGVDQRYIHGQLRGYGASGWGVYDLKTKTNHYFTVEEYNSGLRTGVWKQGDKQVFTDDPPKRVAMAPYWAKGKDVWNATPDELKKLGLEIDLTDVCPTDANGGIVTVRWRPFDAAQGAPGKVEGRKAGEDQWRESKTKGAELVPNTIKRLAAMPDGKLIGVGSFYGGAFIHDPATGRQTPLGPGPGSVYDIMVLGGKVYFSGYAGMFAVYDPTQPWTYIKQDPKGKNPTTYLCGGKYNFFPALGADGRIYVACSHERETPAGASLQCYDPAQPGPLKPLLRKEVLDYYPSDLVAVNGGKVMVMGYGDQLIVYDVEQQAMVKRIALPKLLAGKLLDAAPDQVVGLSHPPAKPGLKAADDVGLLYKVNVKTGEVLYVKTIPGRVFRGQLDGELLWADARFARGPDGCGWLFIDKWLSRINPQDGAVEKIMELESRGRMFFVGDDLYLYNGGRQRFGGFAGILRIRNVFE